MEVVSISTNEMPKASRIDKLKDVFFPLLSTKRRLPIVRKICNIINGNPDGFIVFFSHSTFGLEIRQLIHLYPKLRIVTFYHNIETNLAWRECKANTTLITIQKLILTPIREFFSAKKSSLNIVLNPRDSSLLSKYYGDQKTLIFPTSLYDRFQADKKRHRIDNSPLRLIFVGTYFFGNIVGIKRFIQNVLPDLHNVTLTIVGNDMQRIAEEMPVPENVNVLGYVSNDRLEECYHSADIAILPILDGGGMKTKTAEAMMYHLPVIGTKEAFCGYEIDNQDIGLCSDNMNEWVEFINKIEGNNDLILKMGENSRLLFCEKYETIKNVDKLQNAIQNL